MLQNSVSKFRTLFLCVFCLICFFTASAQTIPSLAPNFLKLPEKNFAFDFRWQGDTVNGKWEPHAALLLPVKFPGCPQRFYLQFDSGVPSTIFYKNQLKRIHTKFPKTRQIEDTDSLLKAVDFMIANMDVFAKEVSLIDYTSADINWNNKNEVEIIGTIGTDFIESRVVVIDYPAKRFYNGINLPKKFKSSTSLSSFVFARRTVLLPAVVHGKTSMLFFDSGSSAYELLTDKKTAGMLARPGTGISSYPVRSWNRTWTATTVITGDSLVIASQKLPLRHATYMDGVNATQVEQMMKMGIGGMTGNKLFVDCVLLLDAKSGKFGLLKTKK